MTIPWQLPTGNIGHLEEKFRIVPQTKALNETIHRSTYTSYVCLNLSEETYFGSQSILYMACIKFRAHVGMSAHVVCVCVCFAEDETQRLAQAR